MSSRRDIGRLRHELEELFGQAWGGPRFAARHCLRPPVDCYRTEDPPELVVVLELAGIDPEDVQVVADDSTLLIAGERHRPRRGEGRLYQQMEIAYGRFERRIALPDDVRADEAAATYERGILRIVFPVAVQEVPAARIPIPVRRAR
jgi:HSP20 family protein